MDEQTLAALRGSIEKWRGIAAGTRRNGGASDCPLCRLFNTPWNAMTGPSPCVGCPVRAKTEEQFCHGTPYYDFIDFGEHPEDATKMANFLESLLPPEPAAAEPPAPERSRPWWF